MFFEDVPLSAVSKSKNCLPFASLLLSSREISLSNGLWDCHGPMDPSVPANLSPKVQIPIEHNIYRLLFQKLIDRY